MARPAPRLIALNRVVNCVKLPNTHFLGSEVRAHCRSGPRSRVMPAPQAGVQGLEDQNQGLSGVFAPCRDVLDCTRMVQEKSLLWDTQLASAVRSVRPEKDLEICASDFLWSQEAARNDPHTAAAAATVSCASSGSSSCRCCSSSSISGGVKAPPVKGCWLAAAATTAGALAAAAGGSPVRSHR